MSDNETLVTEKVTYSIEVDGRFIIIEDVPARVNVKQARSTFPQKPLNVYSKLSGNNIVLFVLSRLLCMNTPHLCLKRTQN